jgi:hypothetical protein
MGPLTFNHEPTSCDDDLFNDAAIASEDQAELMQWHERLRHLPFSFIKQLATNREIPVQSKDTQPPSRCAGCLFGKMTKAPWQTSKTKSKIKEVTRPGHASLLIKCN